jgi:DNA-directed RNA polymerase subunit RPC12/RpoP
MQFLQKIFFYMNGRYGMDEFSKALMIAGIIFGALANFIGGRITASVGLALIAFGALRPLSKEIENRQKEYRWYIHVKQTIQTKYHRLKNKQVQRKRFKIYKCPECKQKVRVPRGRKKIRITCPTCKHQFVKKS